MHPLHLVGVVGNLGERLVLKILWDERFDVVEIESEVGIKEILDGLQLGCCRVDAGDHSVCATFMVMEVMASVGTGMLGWLVAVAYEQSNQWLDSSRIICCILISVKDPRDSILIPAKIGLTHTPRSYI